MFWDANAGNFASWRVAWACGFTFQGVIPQGLDHRGTVVDAWRASVGRDDDLTRPVKPWREQVVLGARGPVAAVEGRRCRCLRTRQLAQPLHAAGSGADRRDL